MCIKQILFVHQYPSLVCELPTASVQPAVAQLAQLAPLLSCRCMMLCGVKIGSGAGSRMYFCFDEWREAKGADVQ